MINYPNFLSSIIGVVIKETALIIRGACSEVLRGGVSIILFWMV